MDKKQGVSERAMKPRKIKLETGAQYVGIKLPPQLAARMRIVAATQGISFAELSRAVLPLGLDEYLRNGHLDLAALEAMETSASFNALREAPGATQAVPR